jgi:hypothetical protein
MKLREFLKARRKATLNSILEYRKINSNVLLLQWYALKSLSNTDPSIASAADALVDDGFRVRQRAQRAVLRLNALRFLGLYSLPWLLTLSPPGIDSHLGRLILPIYSSFMEKGLEVIRRADPESHAKVTKGLQTMIQVEPVASQSP